jgi:hypothetical protein
MNASDRLSASVRLKRMDPQKLTRGRLLDVWITSSKKEVSALLVSAGFEPGTKEFKSRESFYSQARKIGMGHAAALKMEGELSESGMTTGTLTNHLELVGYSQRELVEAITLRNRGILPDDTTPQARGAYPLKGGLNTAHVHGASATNFPIVPAVEWDAQGVDVQQYTGGFEFLALPQQVGNTARRLSFPDDSFAPEIRKGDVVVVEYGATPLPNDIVLCRSTHLDLNFPGRYIQGMDGRSHVELNQPGFDQRVSADDVAIIAVVMYFLVGRKGRMPG